MSKLLLTFLVVTSLLSLFTIYLFVRSVVIPYIREVRYVKQEKKYEKDNLRPFFFEHGRVKIFAKTQPQADAKYKEFKKSVKSIKNSSKKSK